MSSKESDPYSLLGVERQASASDINRAYRRAARATHPDARPGDPVATEEFKALAAAYETLSDPGQRAAYDRAHPVERERGAPRGERPRWVETPPQRRVPHWVEPPASTFTVEQELERVASLVSRWFRAVW